MALFRKPVCENLKKKNKAMTRIDSQDDENTDSMMIYKPKNTKDSSLESLYDTDGNNVNNRQPIRYNKWIGLGIGFVVLWIVIIFVLINL